MNDEEVDPKLLERPCTSSDGAAAEAGPTVSISHLFSRALLPSTLIYMCIWFSLSFGSYGLSTWITVLFEDIGMGNVYASAFIFAMANLPGNIASLMYIDKVGRRRFLAAGMGLAALSAVGFAEGTSAPAVVILCATLFNAFSVAGWNALDCMSVENFPTEVRTSAMGMLAASGRIGAICAQFVNGSLEKNVPVLLFVTSGCMMLGGIAALFTPHDATGHALADHAM
jgi:MFS family permease